MDTHSRRIAVPFALGLTLAAAAHAQPPAPAPAAATPAAPAAEPIKVTPYGIAYFNLFANSDAVNNGDVPLFAAATGPGHTGMTARQSRLGIRVTGARVGAAKVTGVLEGDFFGGYPAVGIGDNMGVFRLRLAHARLDWARGSLVVGQDWMIFAPVNPLSISAAGIPLFAAAGNPWSRLPQIRGEWKTPTMLLQGGVLAPQTGDFNAAFFYQPGSGALAETPFLQGRAAVVLADFAHAKKAATIGVSGHWGRSRVTATGIDRTIGSHGVAADWVLPIGPRVTVQGEAFTGSNLGGFQAGVFQGLVADGAVVNADGSVSLDGPRGIGTTGGWVQVTAAVTPAVTVHAGIGTDDPDDVDVVTIVRREARLGNTAMSFGVQHRASAQIAWGVEYRRMKTTYLIARDTDAGHVNVGFTFTF